MGPEGVEGDCLTPLRGNIVLDVGLLAASHYGGKHH